MKRTVFSTCGSRDWYHWLLETLEEAGDAIDVFYDGSGNHRHFNQPVRDAQPKIVIADQQAAVRFDGKDMYGQTVGKRLLGLRILTTGDQRATELAVAFRESPEAARRLCLLVGPPDPRR